MQDLSRRNLAKILAAASAVALVVPDYAAAQVQWTGWSEVPGGGLTRDAPAAVAYGDRLYLIVRGTNDHIFVNRLDGTTWTGWSEVPGGGLTLSGPAAAVYRDRLYLIVRGTNDHIFVNRYDGSP